MFGWGYRKSVNALRSSGRTSRCYRSTFPRGPRWTFWRRSPAGASRSPRSSNTSNATAMLLSPWSAKRPIGCGPGVRKTGFERSTLRRSHLCDRFRSPATCSSSRWTVCSPTSAASPVSSRSSKSTRPSRSNSPRQGSRRPPKCHHGFAKCGRRGCIGWKTASRRRHEVADRERP